MKTLCGILPSFSQRQGVAVKYFSSGKWWELSWPEYIQKIILTASALNQLGVTSGTRVAIMANTRFEWSILDLAVLGLGAQVIPIYQTVTEEDLEYILHHSEAAFLFIENQSVYRTFRPTSGKFQELKKILSFEEIESDSELTGDFTSLLKTGKLSFQDDFLNSCKKIKANDIATILYTSGTTGTPKGVVLTHDSALTEVAEAFPSCGVTNQDISLTFLPYAHILGRIEHWGHVYSGFTMAFSESLEKIKSNLLEIRPTILVSVPRIFEKIYASIITQLEANSVQKKLMAEALKIGAELSEYRLQRRVVPLALAVKYELAKSLVLSKVKEAFGGRLRFAISGGAPLNRDIATFFHSCEILILEGYGLTETTGAITVNTPYDYQFGSVGKPIGETQIRIADDGEILIKSRKVMREYFKDEESTKHSFTDGWFHTGDIGELTSNGSLRITDRKKDLIKTANGKYVAPQKIEGLLKVNPIISQVLIHGDQRKYIVALITLDKNLVIKFAQDRQINYSEYSELVEHTMITNLVRQEIASANSSLASYESIKRFKVLSTEFTVENGELTPSLKVKRKVLDKKYSDEIEKLYL